MQSNPGTSTPLVPTGMNMGVSAAKWGRVILDALHCGEAQMSDHSALSATNTSHRAEDDAAQQSRDTSRLGLTWLVLVWPEPRR